MHTIDKYHIFFFNDTATTEIYTLSLHDALPIYACVPSSTMTKLRLWMWMSETSVRYCAHIESFSHSQESPLDRKSTRLNSSHANISYAVFCLKKKKTHNLTNTLLNFIYSTISYS